MSRYVIMGRDECGQEFNAGDKYYSCQEEAHADLDRVAAQYEEARGFWVEPLYSDVYSGRSFWNQEEFDEQMEYDEY